MADYTIEEQKAIAKLRVRMQNELPNEFYEDELFLYKFLKARNFNLKQTESMIIKHLNFRKFTQLDTILRDYKPREVLEKYVCPTFIGFSKEGCPISYIPLGTIDGPGLFKSMNSNCVIKDILVRLELDKEMHKRQTKKLGKLVSQSIFIYNMEKFSIFQATHKSSIQMFMRGVQTFQDNYPEMLKTVYIINAHIYSTWAFAMVKTIMASGLLDKIKIFGKTGWKEELLEEIDANELPAFLGGNKTDPDGNPLCLSFVNHGGKIPESYYTEKNIDRTSQKIGMKYLKIERQSKQTVDINVDQPSSILHWEFETVNYDVGFGLSKETVGKENHEELIPVNKVETGLEPTCGMYRCNEPGKYTIIFDNSYSWLHPKEVYYRTYITDSKEAEEYLMLKNN